MEAVVLEAAIPGSQLAASDGPGSVQKETQVIDHKCLKLTINPLVW